MEILQTFNNNDTLFGSIGVFQISGFVTKCLKIETGMHDF